jgi:parallel beta-helix repeat protein
VTRAVRTRAALRRCVGVLTAVLMLPVLLAITTPYSSVAEAVTRVGNLWTVTPGAAAEIQPAIDAARDNGGGRVRLPAGVYLLTSKVRIHTNVTVYGDGMDQTILRWAPGATVDHMMSNGSTGNGNTNFQVWGLTLDGQNRYGCDDGCHGIRLIHADNSFLVNVAVINHTLDGIYMGYTHQDGAIYGVNNVRISGCRANGNSRNGIALTHGDGNIIDGCQVSNNNRGEAVAGIDLEPDEGLVVNNNKLIGNTASGQNVGIQLFEANNDYATMYHNAVCYNTTTGNNAGIFSFRGDQNIFVANNSSGNGVNFEVDDSSLVGSQYASWCAIGQLPPHPSTIHDAPPPSCSPRPAVTVTSQRGALGTLNVTVTATRPAAAPNNVVKQIQFGPALNATVEINGQSRPGGNFTATIPAGTQSVQFVVRRTPTNAPATTVPFTVTDQCGDWNSFVGGGASAF